MSKIYVSRTGVAEEAKVYLPFGEEVRELQKAYRGNAQGIAELIWEKQSSGGMPTYTGTMEIVEYEEGKWYARLLSGGYLEFSNTITVDFFLCGPGGEGGNTVATYSNYPYNGAAGGGGGGACASLYNKPMGPGVECSVVMTDYESRLYIDQVSIGRAYKGSGGIIGSNAKSAGVASGGYGGEGGYFYWDSTTSEARGSGGGGGVTASAVTPGAGGRNGSDGTAASTGGAGGLGGGITTKPFDGVGAPWNDFETEFSIGGTGGSTNTTGISALPNTGNGGSGAGRKNSAYANSTIYYGGSGGSGIVIIRWGNW